ncbi:hypothetical protein [Persicirhabdus sediminis]|uniref:Uncharacterized protein n=1 Tax=Persicirhabdus sediminis TaxID=454144 RepID=A0A8J7MD57_9BACT|nr:hypothetical protein [Persicirhabdus sediminis]MBK1791207.1 hypothetical protein [Persicirhabdus sediminis]
MNSPTFPAALILAAITLSSCNQYDSEISPVPVQDSEPYFSRSQMEKRIEDRNDRIKRNRDVIFDRDSRYDEELLEQQRAAEAKQDVIYVQ